MRPQDKAEPLFQRAHFKEKAMVISGSTTAAAE
jgi:hypothetical protein